MTVDVVVVGVVVPVPEVPPVDVVDVAVVVVVDAVVGDLAGVDPDACCQIGVVELDARIDYGDHHGCCSCCCVPRSGCVDARGFNKTPLVVNERVVGELGGVDDVVQTGYFDGVFGL